LEQPVEVEATGETVGEAKWSALRQLERLHPGLDRSAVSFEVLTEGERGLLGVGYSPARVVATVPPGAVAAPAAPLDESALAASMRELVERVTAALGVRCRVDVVETDEAVTVTCAGAELGLLIGRHGQTIDALQHLANAIVMREARDTRKEVVVDAAGYRERRRAMLESLADRTAERVRRSGEEVALEPMAPAERKIVHVRLAELDGVETRSEGSEPARYVVVEPA
jgi:spoIIIJ-associated protein